MRVVDLQQHKLAARSAEIEGRSENKQQSSGGVQVRNRNGQQDYLRAGCHDPKVEPKYENVPGERVLHGGEILRVVIIKEHQLIAHDRVSQSL